jgi:hypothetical protein
MRILGLALRTLFLAVVLALTARVAGPQTETLLSAYDTPSELVRMALGAAVCVFVFVQIFRYPKDPADMRNWVFIGLAAVPLALLCAATIW